jgi:hypothetical protein
VADANNTQNNPKIHPNIAVKLELCNEREAQLLALTNAEFTADGQMGVRDKDGDDCSCIGILKGYSLQCGCTFYKLILSPRYA